MTVSSTRKTSDEFVGATGDYATYTNDVDKPYAQPKAEPVEAPEHAKAQNPPEPGEFYGKGDAGSGARPASGGGEKSPEPKAEKPKADAPKTPAK